MRKLAILVSLATMSCSAISGLWAQRSGAAGQGSDRSDVQSFPGRDVGEKINAAVASCPTRCMLKLQAGDYSYTTPIHLGFGVTIEGEGRYATTLMFRGVGPGVVLGNNAQMRDLSLVFSEDTREGIRIAGEHISIAKIALRGGSAATTLVHVTAVDGTTRSGRTRLDDIDFTDFAGIGILVDHAVDTFIRDVEAYSSLENRTAHAVVIDTGAANVQMDNINGGASGAGALLVRHTQLGGSGGYGLAPLQLWCYRCVSDGLQFPGDAIRFDKSLAANVVQATLLEPWAAGFTNGIHIEGGHGIKIIGGIVRANVHDGVLIDSADADSISILGTQIQVNGFAGVDIVASGSVSVSECLIGNVIDTGGQQAYGIHLGRQSSDAVRIIGNDLRLNRLGGLASDGPLSSKAIVSANANPVAGGNTPSSATQACMPNASWDDDSYHYHCNETGSAMVRVKLQPF